MWSLLTNQRSPLPQLMTRLFVVIIANQIKEETRLLIVRTNNCKAGAKKSKQGRGNKLWIREFWCSLCAGCAGCPGVRVCIIKQRPSEIMNVWCQAGMWRRCDVLFIIGICVLYISIILFAYSIIIGADLGPGLDNHWDIIEYWLYRDEGDWVIRKNESTSFTKVRYSF